MPAQRWTSESNAVGVWLSTLTRSSMSSLRNRSGARAVSRSTTTTVPPEVSGPQISQTEKSKAIEWNSVHRSAAPYPSAARPSASREARFPWVTVTPLGAPVEPEV